MQHINQLITTTLRESVLESLASIKDMIDPSARSATSLPVIEVRLELVAPELLFFPQISANLSHTSLEDLVELWISSTLNIGTLLQRIDSGESNYYSQICDCDDVQELVTAVRDHSKAAFLEASAMYFIFCIFMHACVYIYLYVCMYVCMYIYIYIYIVCIYIYIYIYIYARTHARTHTHTHIDAHTQTHTHSHTHTHMHTCTHAGKSTSSKVPSILSFLA
jgi:hypothetical protein